jgi:hypothetical protein
VLRLRQVLRLRLLLLLLLRLLRRVVTQRVPYRIGHAHLVYGPGLPRVAEDDGADDELAEQDESDDGSRDDEAYRVSAQDQPQDHAEYGETDPSAFPDPFSLTCHYFSSPDEFL